MKKFVNKNLITLKCVLFCFLSGVGCIFPFLPLHMLACGLEKGEARLISAVAPCVALLGPAIIGPLMDKLSVGRGSTGGAGTGPGGSGKLLRIVTAICMILCAVFFLLLTTVPHTNRGKINRPTVYFMCNEHGASVIQQGCTEGPKCNHWDGEKKGVIAVTQCEYGCSDNTMEWLQQPFPTTTPQTDPEYFESDDDENPPHICSDGQCQVYLQDGRLRVPITLVAPPDADNDTLQTDYCTYSTLGRFHCPVPEPRLSMLGGPMCAAGVRCAVLDPYDEPGAVLGDNHCQRVSGDPSYTFGAYFIIRVLADIWPTTVLALLGAACVIATRETSLGRGDVGRQLAFGTLGLAIFPPLAALAADQVPDTPYLIPFIMNAVFMVIGALILIFDGSMPLSAPEWWWHTSRGAVALPLSAVRRYGPETAAVFGVITLLGLLWAAIDSYLPWTLTRLHGSVLEVGLSLTIGALPALPALFWAERLVDYLGHNNIFIASFTFYCLRFTALGFPGDSTSWVLVSEALEVFTLSLTWVTAVLYFRHLVPKRYTATGQALPVIAHFCIGRCIGAIVGGLQSPSGEVAGAVAVYRALAVVSLVTAGVYLPLYHGLLAPRCHAPALPPPPQLLGPSTNGSANGGSPLRVYHEERSRKGHFRY